ncbi:FAD-binding domain-containing protein [Mycena alexandri]|uniref:FAD-binding domain-containing protein n=1 Tax=Mycena alexandri TaxID=1745969 RepID=A0AAD6SF26_9AGAR|nr:FAD-binding domain-containing protein [Mycena alexandri]
MDFAHGEWSTTVFAAVPLARSCFQASPLDGAYDAATCQEVQSDYLNPITRSGTFAGYMATQSETCSTTGARCFLDWQNVTDTAAFDPPQSCQQGSISPHYIDVKTVSDVQAAFLFSNRTGVPLVIKNTGHDYKGRSSSPNSLGLWSHNLKSTSFSARFTPHGCSADTTFAAATIGAGVQTADLYAWANTQSITLPGGACSTGGIVGGYLQLHIAEATGSRLSNIYGLAVDRVLEYEIVTPTGQHLFANACQNTDLFFALRGGGGGTFGFVLAATMKVLPQVSYTTVEVDYASNSTTLPIFISFLISNGVKWATDGWSGQIRPGAKLVMTAVNTTEDAATSYMSDLRTVAAQIGGTFTVSTTPSYLAYYDKYIVPDALNELDGIPQTVGSRLISADALSANPGELLNALVNITVNSAASFIFANAPFNFKQDASLGPPSVTPAWRNSVWHVIAGTGWTYNTPAASQSYLYNTISSSIEPLRAITPSGGAYQNT